MWHLTEQGHFLGDFRVLLGLRAPHRGSPSFASLRPSPLTGASGRQAQASHAPGTRASCLPPPPSQEQQGPEQPSTRRTGLPTQETPSAFCTPPPPQQEPSRGMGSPHAYPCGARGSLAAHFLHGTVCPPARPGHPRKRGAAARGAAAVLPQEGGSYPQHDRALLQLGIAVVEHVSSDRGLGRDAGPGPGGGDAQVEHSFAAQELADARPQDLATVGLSEITQPLRSGRCPFHAQAPAAGGPGSATLPGAHWLLCGHRQRPPGPMTRERPRPPPPIQQSGPGPPRSQINAKGSEGCPGPSQPGVLHAHWYTCTSAFMNLLHRHTLMVKGEGG